MGRTAPPTQFPKPYIPAPNPHTRFAQIVPSCFPPESWSLGSVARLGYLRDGALATARLVMVKHDATDVDLSICAGVTVVLAVVSALGIFVGKDSEKGGGPKDEGLLASVSAGVVLSVSWLHLLDDAQDTLEGLTDYPAAMCAMLVGFLLMWFCQAQTRYHHSSGSPSSWNCCVAHRRRDGEGTLLLKAPSSPPPNSTMVTRFHVMEASISFHSFMIGLGIGFAQGGWRAQLVLGASLCVHQFFEGCAVGTVGTKVKLSQSAWRRTFVVFSLSLPSGVAIAVAVQLIATVGSNVGYQWALGLLTAGVAGQPRTVQFLSVAY